MRYDLLLQAKELGAPYDLSAVDAGLKARGALERPDGVRIWRLKGGDVEVQCIKENGIVIATELKAPLSHKTELIRELVVEAAGLATEANVQLVDPSLSKTLTAKDDALVADQYFRTAQYAGQYAGVSEAVMASYGVEEPGMKAGTKVLLGIAAFFVVLYVVFDWLL